MVVVTMRPGVSMTSAPNSFRLCVLAATCSCLLSASVMARIEVQVSRVGFPSLSRDIVRAGCWTPIYVDISLVDQPSFDGSIRAAQLDTDGDEAFDSVEVHVRSETGGHTRQILYVPANPAAADSRFAVELRDHDGSLVQVISNGELVSRAVPTDLPDIVSHDDVVILSVGAGAIGHVKDLATSRQGGGLRQAVHVAHISPTDLPEHWIGLESIDYIVWEDAKPELLSPRQLDALLEWCRYGGTLLVAASDSASSFAMTKPFAAVLPGDVTEVVAISNLPITRQAMLAQPVAEERTSTANWYEIPFSPPVRLAMVNARKQARVVVRETVQPISGGQRQADVITRASLGSGHIILCAVKMHDLFSAPGVASTFFERLFHFIPSSGPNQAVLTPVSLFGNVASAVGFVRSRSAYLVFTFLFALCYVGLATGGTWWFLGKRGWRQHSWTAFAAVALAAGVGAGLAVGASRGITDRLQQIAIIDADADDSFGRGTVLFGLKTGLDKRLDLWLPSDWLMAREPEFSSCFLRPLPAGSEWRRGESFADPEEYGLHPASAEILDARFRATLKRFEGRWEGPLGGKLTAQIAIRSKDRDKLLTEDSYIVNNLGVELTQCRLIHTLFDPGAIATERSSATYVYLVDGSLPSDGTKIQLFNRCFQLKDPQKLSDIVEQSKLKKNHSDWSQQFRGLWPGLAGSRSDEAKAALGKEREALMLLSTIGDFDPGTIPPSFGGGAYTFSRDRLRQLDLRERLTAGHNADEKKGIPADSRGTMMLIGFARGGGPIRLMSRSGERPYAAITPEEESSWCMYRIRLPFIDLDKVAAAGDAESVPRP